MDFYTWLAKYRIEQKDMSKRLGVSAKYLSAIVNGRRKPGETLIILILHLTNNEVTRKSLLEPRKR